MRGKERGRETKVYAVIKADAFDALHHFPDRLPHSAPCMTADDIREKERKRLFSCPCACTFDRTHGERRGRDANPASKTVISFTDPALKSAAIQAFLSLFPSTIHLRPAKLLWLWICQSYASFCQRYAFLFLPLLSLTKR